MEKTPRAKYSPEFRQQSLFLATAKKRPPIVPTITLAAHGSRHAELLVDFGNHVHSTGCHDLNEESVPMHQ